MSSLVIRDAEVAGRRTDVTVARGMVTAIEPAGGARPAGAEVVDAGGGALLPGLHDHHVHLVSAAAARDSLDLAHSAPRGPAAVAHAIGGHPGTGWLRVIGYHESMAGPLDREVLDAWCPDRPVRVQHRSGALWILNSRALDALGPAVRHAPPGLERDGEGRPTGRGRRIDRWLREHLPAAARPDVGAASRELARLGFTGLTDMTPYETLDEARPLLDAAAAGEVVQRVVVTGAPGFPTADLPAGVDVGPVKILFDDASPPPFDDLVAWVVDAHEAGRPVAVHCVTRAALALMVAVWDVAGVHPGDRVEHGAVVPPDLRHAVAERGLTVVTQPAFVRTRGDAYLADVDPHDLAHLWPCASLLAAGIPVAAGTDQPFGPADPLVTVAAASGRRTAQGRALGTEEAVPPERALELFLGALHAPGGPARRLTVGAPADLCLFDRPLREVLRAAPADVMRRTFVGGTRVSQG